MAISPALNSRRIQYETSVKMVTRLEFKVGRCDPAVPGGGRARPLIETDRAGPREPGGCRGVVRGGLVDDDELTAGYGGRFQRGQTFGEVRRVIVDGNDDGQPDGVLANGEAIRKFDATSRVHGAR